MGLDQYMLGEEQGQQETVELAYWRKHPDLHGYIVTKFAKGVDECQKIPLSTGSLIDIWHAVRDDKLPFTQGFFFGKSFPEDREPTMRDLEKVIAWAEADLKNRRVYYQASW